MKNIKCALLMAVLLLLGVMLYGQQQSGYTSLPYFCGFENLEDTIGTYGWKFEKRPKVNHTFVVGEAVHRMGSRAMYVSADSAKTAGYSFTTSGSVVIAYKGFYLEKGKYDLMFEYRMQGEDHKESDVMRVAFYKGAKPTTTSMGSFPQYALDNKFVSSKGDEVFKTSLWTQVEGQVEAPDSGYYYLVFLFKEDGDKNVYAPGACIDNIQFDRTKSPNACATKPTNIFIDKESNGIKLSWTGRATEYEIMYNRVSSLKDTNVVIINGITTTEYSIPYSIIPEGVYNFRIRALCPNDTSMWVEKANYIVYDDAKHCLNYLDFTNGATKCFFGTFESPKEQNRPIDYGYESRHSIHTVHYMQDEYDRLTGYKLKTVPDGEMASVRLGNWTEGPHGDSPTSNHGSPSGVIEYTYTIPKDKSVLLLKYAAVLQYAEHHAPEEQTSIKVEIVNTTVGRERVLKCASADFNARDISENNTRGWKTYYPKEGEVISNECPIKWLDWTTLGINLADYMGTTVKIRIKLTACVADYHFAYGYFVLDCTEGEIEGMSCTEKADTLFVPSGFDYLWYVQGDNNKTPVSTEQYFVVPEDDINSYSVDLIYPEDNGCYFTLNANVWPRIPKVDMDYTIKPQNCVNYVELINKSKMVDLKMDKEGNVTDTLDVAESVAGIKDYYLEIRSDKNTLFENGLTVSPDPNMRIIVPNEGDTFVVVMKGMFNSCEDIREYELNVPKLQPSFTEIVRYVCDGVEVKFNDFIYNEPGVYVDTLQTIYGCDSILQLTLKTLVTDTIKLDTAICSAELPFVWDVNMELDTLMQSGVYEKPVPSSLGCDSLYYILNLNVLESLVLNFDMPTICADDDEIEIDYVLESGMLTGYNVAYSEKAKKVGFEDVEVLDSVGEMESIKLVLPETLRPDKYEVKFTFYNSDCGNLDTTLVFDVLYPDSVIAQRWNDVLAVKNSNYNGGYEFVAYQWFLNGVPLDGFTTSQYYTGEDLDFNGEYQVLLTRKDDGVEAFTCGIVPTKFEEEILTNGGVLVFVVSNSSVNIETSESAKCCIYNTSGLLCSSFDLDKGSNSVELPYESGVYIVHLLYANGDVDVQKIVFNKK